MRASASASIGLLGFGNVGQAIADVAAASFARVTAALVRDVDKPRRRQGVDLLDDADELFDRRLDVVIEVMGGVHPAYEHVCRALEAGIPVVTANKTLMARKGGELRALARRYGVPLAYEAAVIAGVPFLGAGAKRPLAGAPRTIAGILNGTSHFLTTALTNGASFEGALATAIDRGYAEPDSSADLGGRDAAEKLTILAHLAACPDLVPEDITTLGVDALTAEDFAAARALDGVIKPIATASFEKALAGAWVGPALVDARHPWAPTSGVFNCVEFDHGGIPVTFSGPGAGPAITAATVLDDVVEVLRGGSVVACRAEAFGGGGRVRAADLRQPASGSWFVRMRGGALRLEDVAEHFAVHRAPAVRLARGDGWLAARTASASWTAVTVAASALAAAGADVLVIPVLEARGE